MSSQNLEKLEKLQSINHSQLLDIIDKLREQGLSNFLHLPQLIVCGDQSSGKSSVLEAISGVPFPKKDSLCTRFATEVVLRKSKATDETQIKVSIHPGQDRSEVDQENLRRFTHSLSNVGELPATIQRAKESMGLGSQGSNAFSTDVLRLEVTGARMPQLTIVDLPGLIHSPTKFQTRQDIKLVSKLVKHYMSQQRSIILAVVTAKNDHANQVVLQMARKEDPKGQRTMGIITKPDTVHKDSESEASFLSLAQNQDVFFNLGWHVVRNLDSNDTSQQGERDQVEAMFFYGSNWESSLNKSALGAPSLRERLSEVLFDQISRELPHLMQEIESCRHECQDEINRLGRSRKTEHDQRLYLTELYQKAYDICQAGCKGIYDDISFGDGSEEEHECTILRFRSVIQNQGMNFAKTLEKRGAKWVISDENISDRNHITRSQAIDKVVILLQNSRGRELPGTFNPMLISKLFQEYSKPWEAIAKGHVNSIWKQAKTFLDQVLRSFADGSVSNEYSRLILDPEMDSVLFHAYEALDTLLAEMKRHASTYNHYFITNVAKSENEKRKKYLTQQLEKILADRSVGTDDIFWLVPHLMDEIEPDMDRAAAEQVFDKMQAYYKVSMKRFIDNVPSLVIESVIVKRLLTIFAPIQVYDMKETLIQQIAGESTEKEEQREALNQKLLILIKGEATCKRYASQEESLELSFSEAESVANTPTSVGFSVTALEPQAEANVPDMLSRKLRKKEKKRRAKLSLPEATPIVESIDVTPPPQIDIWGTTPSP